MKVSTLISLDVPCLGCGYLLRGLEVLGSCPECGVSIPSSLWTFTSHVPAEIWDDETTGPQLEDEVRKPFVAIAKSSGFDDEAVEFLYDVAAFTEFPIQPGAPASAEFRSPSEFAAAILDRATLCFEQDARQVLEAWGLHRGSHVSAVLRALVLGRLLENTGEDDAWFKELEGLFDDYEGLCKHHQTGA